MAEVFRATASGPAGERHVVIKRMLPHVAEEVGGAEMFAQEARIGSFVRHPNVVSILSNGEDDGNPFLVLEFVPGCDLWRLIRWMRHEGIELPRDLAVMVTLDLLRALQAVHEATDAEGRRLGIVHRDVSPSNLLLSVDGSAKLTDFGIARTLASRASDPGQKAKGKLGYLAPEQIAGERTTHATDVFSAAIIISELLLGVPLFFGASELAILLAIRDVSIGLLLEADLPDELRSPIVTALARDPDERFEDAHGFYQALLPFGPRDEESARVQLGLLVQRAIGRPETLTQPGRQVIFGRTPTLDSESDRYFVTTNGEEREIRFAALMEAITTGELGPEDELSVNGAAPEKLRLIPELARHLPMSTFTPLALDPRAANAPDLRRHLKTGFAKPFAETALKRETGLWLCEHGGIRKEVYLEKGKPRFVGSNLASEMLGEFLVRSSVIDRAELDMALAVLPRFQGRLGDTLVALSLVKAVELVSLIERQLAERLLELFTWSNGSAEFYRGVPGPDSGFSLRMGEWEALERGIERRFKVDTSERAKLVTGRTLQRTVQLPLSSKALPLHYHELLNLAFDPTPCTSLTASSTEAQESKKQRAVWLLIQLELLHWSST